MYCSVLTPSPPSPVWCVSPVGVEERYKTMAGIDQKTGKNHISTSQLMYFSLLCSPCLSSRIISSLTSLLLPHWFSVLPSLSSLTLFLFSHFLFDCFYHSIFYSPIFSPLTLLSSSSLLYPILQPLLCSFLL